MCTNLFHHNRCVESVSGEEKSASVRKGVSLHLEPGSVFPPRRWHRGRGEQTARLWVSMIRRVAGGKLTYFSMVYLNPVRVLSVEVYGVGTWHIRTWGTHLTKHFKYHTWRRLKNFPPSAFKIQGQLWSTHFGAERKHNTLQLLGGPSSWTSCS